MSNQTNSATAPTNIGGNQTEQRREATERLGIFPVDLYVNDHREDGDSPHALGNVEVEAVLGLGEGQATVSFQNHGDGKLSVGSDDRK